MKGTTLFGIMFVIYILVESSMYLVIHEGSRVKDDSWLIYIRI